MPLLECIKTFLFYVKVDRVIFCLFLDKDVDIYEKQMQLFFPRQNVEESSSQNAEVETRSSLNVETESPSQNVEAVTPSQKGEVETPSSQNVEVETPSPK